MSIAEKGIEVKSFGGNWVVSVRKNVTSREELATTLKELTKIVPANKVAGHPFWIRNFIHSYPGGFDAEVCIPLESYLDLDGYVTREFPVYEVLAVNVNGSIDQLGDAYNTVFDSQNDYGLISDEFCIEVLQSKSPLETPIEVMMVRHPWENLFEQNLRSVMGKGAREQVIGDEDVFLIDMSLQDRFNWVRNAIDRFDRISNDEQRFEVLTACSHVFPRNQAEKLRKIYLASIGAGASFLQAVDEVVAFMETDPGWRPNIIRDGHTLYVTKNPSDREAYDRAETDLERQQAACFCPIVRQHIGDGMSDTFCYCSAGFERKQWEVAIGKPVRIEIVKSLLKGHLECQFAIKLTEE